MAEGGSGWCAEKELLISYGREPGTKKFVQQLKRDLESYGIRVWLDVDDIPSGSEWLQEIGLALKHCDAILALVTKKYVSSQYCKGELHVASSNKKKIFPLIYEDGWMDVEGGSGVHVIIAPFNWTFFRPKDDYSDSFQKLIAGISEYLKTIPHGEDDEPDQPTTTEYPAHSKLGERPTLPQLQTLKKKDGKKIEIIKTTATKWKEIGIALEFDDDGTQVDFIQGEWRMSGILECCTQMFRHWLAGNGKDQTWAVLIETLEDCELKYLAGQIRRALV